MTWLYIYLIGVAMTFFLTVVSFTYEGRKAVGACLISAIIWPIIWIYAAGRAVGDWLR